MDVSGSTHLAELLPGRARLAQFRQTRVHERVLEDMDLVRHRCDLLLVCKCEAEGRATEQNGERFEVDGGEWRGRIRRNEAGSGATPAPATLRLA